MSIKKFLASTTVSALMLGSIMTPAIAAVHTSTGQQLNASTCSGNLLANITYKQINDYDSGVGGNAWANDSIHRTLKIYDEGNGAYCALVKDSGQFVTFAGMSPLDTTVNIPAGITGTLDGGYVATFNATAFNPQLPTNGSLGTYNDACTNAYTCPGALDWPSLYFSGVTNFNLPYWAWNYHAGNNGSMVQASTGYQGNIVNN